jgi:hypothetical protein
MSDFHIADRQNADKIADRQNAYKIADRQNVDKIADRQNVDKISGDVPLIRIVILISAS